MTTRGRIDFRPGDALLTALEEERAQAGERTLSVTVRRLLVQSLGKPAFTPAERDQLDQIRLQISYLGNNLNQLLRHAYMRDVATGFDWPALENTAAELGRVRQRLANTLNGRL